HRAFAADIVGSDAADDAARGPPEHRRRKYVPRVAWNLRVLRRVEQLVQREADRQEQRIDLKTIKQPAEVRGDEHPPLLAIQRTIPGRRCVGVHAENLTVLHYPQLQEAGERYSL